MSAASITVTDLAWSAPGGLAVFSNLNLTFGSERAGLVGCNGVGKTTLLRLIAGELTPEAGSVSVRARLAMLRQTVQVAPQETVADLFGVTEALAVLARAEAGEATEQDLISADWTVGARMSSALARMGLAAEPGTRLAALSGGQRTRAALAALLFKEPEFLILDEPTNNLDHDGRTAVIELLAGWQAGALTVSHDRELLEGMDAIIELTSFGTTRYGGGWSAYRTRKAVELAAAEHDLANAEKRVEEIAQATQAQAERKARQDSAGRRKAGRGDAPKILLGARKDRAQSTGGELARLAERRAQQAQASAVAARERIEVLAPLSVALQSTGLWAGKEILRLERVTAGYELDRPIIADLSLTITGPERVAITGPNGSGKSTLLSVIVGDLEPRTGCVRRGTELALLDQRVSVLDPNASILDNFRRLNGGVDHNSCRAALARFAFRAEAALQEAGALSGGQLLRAGLACVLGGSRPPPLLILDEPTNHLDIESIKAVEAGLSAYDGALIVVSHDGAFLEAVGVTKRIQLGRS
jgi:ATPase subunit of ABC transporter with duplicated ATPase domains